jgi:cytochrome c biogenesis protein CcdA
MASEAAINRTKKKYILFLNALLMVFYLPGLVILYVTQFYYSGVLSISLVISFVIYLFGIIGTEVADKAEAKGKSWKAFFWLSILISPLITWLVVSSIQPENGKIVLGSRACPMCAEPVKVEAKLCKHCGSSI